MLTASSARATSAAPRYFKPFCHEPSKQVLMDGAIYHNNPVHVADTERKLLWPSLSNEHPDLVVSIGTSYKSCKNSIVDMKSVPLPSKGVVSHGKSLFKIAVDHFASALDSEKTWHSYLGILEPAPSHRHRYVRLNPQLDQEPPALDRVESMKTLQALSRADMSENPTIPKVANQLVASSFYFESSGYEQRILDESVQYSGMLIETQVRATVRLKNETGHIHCRLLPDSQEICELGRFLQGKMQLRQGLYFVGREQNAKSEPQYFKFTSNDVENMIRQRRFKSSQVNMRLSNKLAMVEIALFLGSGDSYPISLFPRSLLEDEEPKRGEQPI